MTITNETVDRAAREPSDAELAAEFIMMAGSDPRNGPAYCDYERGLFRLAAQRLEARREISEAMVETVAFAFCDLPKRACGPCLEKARAALEAALSGEKDGNHGQVRQG